MSSTYNEESCINASLMLDIKAFLAEFKEYTPEMEKTLNERVETLKGAYSEAECSRKIINCAKAYILKKYAERVIVEKYYNKIENDFFDEIISSLCNGTPLPDPEDYKLPMITDTEGNQVRYTHFTAEKLVPFMMKQL